MTRPATQKKPKKKRRRRAATPEKPISIAGRAPITETLPPRPRPLAPMWRAIVGALPAHEESAKGRSGANVMRVLMGAVAVWLVTQGGVAGGIAGVALALLTVLIPLPESRKRRWLKQATSVGLPRESTALHDATVEFDGKKLAVRCNDRTWGSMRPRQPRATIHVHEQDGALLMGLRQPRRPAKDELWFSAPRDAVGETYDPLELDEFGHAPDARIVHVDGAGWAQLHEALHAQPRP